MTRIAWAVVGIVLLALSARAQDVPAGPEKGKAVPALKVFDATGSHEGKEVDYAAERKAKATVYLFVQADKWDRPMARFLRKLDEEVQKDEGNPYIVAVWVGGDSDKMKEYLPRVQKSLQLKSTALTAFIGDAAGPEGWGVNGEAHLGVVVAVKGTVAANFGYRSVNDGDVPGVRAAMKQP